MNTSNFLKVLLLTVHLNDNILHCSTDSIINNPWYEQQYQPYYYRYLNQPTRVPVVTGNHRLHKVTTNQNNRNFNFEQQNWSLRNRPASKFRQILNNYSSKQKLNGEKSVKPISHTYVKIGLQAVDKEKFPEITKKLNDSVFGARTSILKASKVSKVHAIDEKVSKVHTIDEKKIDRKTGPSPPRSSHVSSTFEYPLYLTDILKSNTYKKATTTTGG